MATATKSKGSKSSKARAMADRYRFVDMPPKLERKSEEFKDWLLDISEELYGEYGTNFYRFVEPSGPGVTSRKRPGAEIYSLTISIGDEAQVDVRKDMKAQTVAGLRTMAERLTKLAAKIERSKMT